MHHAYARGGWLQNDQVRPHCARPHGRRPLTAPTARFGLQGWRAPSPVNNPLNLFPQRLVEHSDPEMRRFFSLWSASMCEWVAGGFDPAYRTHRPTKGSPNPALSSRPPG